MTLQGGNQTWIEPRNGRNEYSPIKLVWGKLNIECFIVMEKDMKKIENSAGYIIKHNGIDISIKRSEEIIRILGKKYTLLIIGVLDSNSAMNFNNIKRYTGCPRSNLLSTRLKEMGRAGIVSRTISESYPIAVKYSLTSKGKELRENLIPLFKWVECNCMTQK